MSLPSRCYLGHRRLTSKTGCALLLFVRIVRQSLGLLGRDVVLRSMSLVVMPPAVSGPMGKESRPVAASLTCEEPSPVRTAPCTAAPYPSASKGGDEPVRSLPSQNSWIMDVLRDSGRASTSSKSCTFFCSTSLFTGVSHEEVLHTKFLEACSSQRARVADVLAKRIISMVACSASCFSPPASPESPALQRRSFPCCHLRAYPQLHSVQIVAHMNNDS